MSFTREQRQIAYKKLSSEVQDFVMSNETSELISNLLSESGLSEEQSNVADSEILDALFGLQTLTEAINNIAKLSEKNTESFSKLKTDLENNIFDQMPKNTQGTSGVTPQTPEPPLKSYDSFEQTILRQAQAMRPARSASDNVAGGPATSAQAPSNLPGARPVEAPKSQPADTDPYREPIE